jgi:hypothetical protein
MANDDKGKDKNTTKEFKYYRNCTHLTQVVPGIDGEHIAVPPGGLVDKLLVSGPVKDLPPHIERIEGFMKFYGSPTRDMAVISRK